MADIERTVARITTTPVPRIDPEPLRSVKLEVGQTLVLRVEFNLEDSSDVAEDVDVWFDSTVRDAASKATELHHRDRAMRDDSEAGELSRTHRFDAPGAYTVEFQVDVVSDRRRWLGGDHEALEAALSGTILVVVS